MDGSLDQLMRLLSNRGLEWLRQRIMALPDPMPDDHPDLACLAYAARMAPVLSGLRGRISPLETIVTRRLTPDLVARASRAVVAGARDEGRVGVVLAGGLVAAGDPLWHLACEALAEDADLPLPHRLILRDDPDLMRRAEAVVTTLPATITPAHVDHVAQVLAQLYRHGAQRPALSHPRAFTAIFAHLSRLADWAQTAGSTAAVAQVAFCLRLVDSDHPMADLIGDLIGAQRPDGSFPPRIGFGHQDQTFAQGVYATLQVAMALHMAAWRRWRGPGPVWLHPDPLADVVRMLADRLAAGGTGGLVDAVLLTRATGCNWLARWDAPRQAGPADLATVARICFRDPIAAHHLRGWLHLPRATGAAPGLAGAERAWLAGAPVRLTPAPPALTALWDRAARRGDDDAFLSCARMALHHGPAPLGPAIRARIRQMTVAAIDGADPARHLDRMILLSQVIQTPDRGTLAA